jgi:hypothetical protein
MRKPTYQAITAHSSNAISSLSLLSQTLFEASLDLPAESLELKLITRDLGRIQQIQKQIEDLDINSNPFGLSNFPFCNKK